MTPADHANAVREALNTGPLPDSQSDRDKLDAGHDALDALQTQAETAEQFQAHEGMVTVYASDGRYVGCMGNELWDWLTVHDRDLVMTAFERAVAAEADLATGAEVAIRLKAERDRARDALRQIKHELGHVTQTPAEAAAKALRIARAALGDTT